MRLYGAIQKVEPQHDGTVRVHGTATSEAVDDQGEIVRADAIRTAIPEYMRFPALREMHQLSAAGTTLEAEVCEDGTTRIVAHVVDPVAVAKVKNQVYRGFSIGGHVTQREAGNPKTITGLVLNEISLVDRPANPEAIFDCWKAAVVSDADPAGPAQGSTLSVSDSVAQDPFNSPLQIWACGVPDHRHLAKADALKCLEKRTVEPMEAKIAITAATAPMVETENVAPPTEPREPAKPNRSNSIECEKTDANVQYTDPDSRLAAGPLVKAKHSQGDQALLDIAFLACDKCLSAGGLSVDEKENMGKARDHLHKAGALPGEGSTFDMMDDAEDLLPAPVTPPGGSVGAQTMKVLGVIAAVLGKAGRAHQHMMDVAHECLNELTDGTICGQAAKTGARHSKQTMEHLGAAHRHLVAAGATCDASTKPGSNTLTEDEKPDTALALGKDTRIGDLAKALAGERAEKAALVKALDEIVPMLDRLTKRVDDIARTPLPPLTIAKGTVSVSKQQDGGGAGDSDTELSPEAIASALGKMSKEEQTLTLIKASYANPIRVLGSE